MKGETSDCSLWTIQDHYKQTVNQEGTLSLNLADSTPNEAIESLENQKVEFPAISGEFNGEGTSGNEAVDNTRKETNEDSENQKADFSAVCGRYSSLWLVAVSLVQLSIYLNKLYHDSAAVRKYFEDRDINLCVVSAFCLFLPALIYVIYVVALYVKDSEQSSAEDVGSKILHGLLLVPWQIKGRVEMLQFSAERAFKRKKLTSEEEREKTLLEHKASLLMFFETFYAGLTQMLLQLYIIITSLDRKVKYNALSGEIVASGLCLLSMMAAIRRRDDAIITGSLAIIGWILIFISRCLAIALATSVMQGWMVAVCALHGVAISLWVESLALRTYEENSAVASLPSKKIALFFLIFCVFGLPSLIFWPFMFELRARKRPLIFLLILIMENIFFVALRAGLRENVWASHDYILLAVTALCFVIGSTFLLIYLHVKSPHVDDIVLYDMRTLGLKSGGIYYEFCDVTCNLVVNPHLAKHLPEIRRRRLLLQN